MRLLRTPTLNDDYFELVDYKELRNPEFVASQLAVYNDFAPGENASNKLSRGIRWGIYVNGEFIWLSRNEYHLDERFNPEERGKIRKFPLIPTGFLHRQEIVKLLNAVFARWGFIEDSYKRAYEVQLSAIRYEPSVAETALPSPMTPHQDQIDGAIVVLHKTKYLVGGVSRIYSLNENPLYEVDIKAGEALLVKDEKIKHQVTPILLNPSDTWRPGTPSFRDILIIRYQPVGR